MPDLLTVTIVCRHRHPLEWVAPVPRTSPCDDCTHVCGLVLEAAFGRIT